MIVWLSSCFSIRASANQFAVTTVTNCAQVWHGGFANAHNKTLTYLQATITHQAKQLCIKALEFQVLNCSKQYMSGW